ncbi:exodeoxyribonuclease V subunit beta [Marinobacter sp. X15-166B]|uniref:exodeoxyribonuclease V subunit beta n=1 Tax=Marinobacter sp. X15-166B TaxID=1897620 RepID=UPI00085BEB3E|nr:exodeoxyribonuclease V subunit beta [Marinobacter sp. X15-166B]OEY67541.1 exodeoxyribonuclease V subunit beta [Marinobacter sp. X15-166B]
MADNLDVLRFPITGSRLIEASAGTGKTFTIALLYVRAVLAHGEIARVGRSLAPSDILVVTFTEAATEELRDRIRQRLAEAAGVFRQPAHPDPAGQVNGDPLYALRDSYDPDSWPAQARLLELAAESMDEAAVHTIHGWCNRMLKEHAFDSGGLFSQTLETDESELVAEVTRDYWRTFVSPLDEDAAGLWLQAIPTPEALQTAASGLKKYLGLLPAATHTPKELLGTLVAARRRVFATARAELPANVTDFTAILAEARNRKAFNGSKLRSNHVENWLARLTEWAEDHELTPPDLSDAAWNRLSRAGMEDAWKSGPAPGDHPLIAAVEQLQAVCATPVPAEQLKLHACGWIAQRLEQEKLRRAQMGFDDLLTRMDRALHGPNGARLAARLRSQFPVAMIDEFQDTDPVQYRIFDRIYELKTNDCASALLMIGDPKQAIYRFRGADIFTYLQAREATVGRHATLPKNYRSASAMVDASNQVFGYAEKFAHRGAFLFREPDGAGHNPVPFSPVEANGREETLEIEGREVAGITFWTDATVATKERVLADTAAACASEIVRLLTLGQAGQAGFRAATGTLTPLRSADIAILVNNGTEARHVRAELDLRGVRSVYLSERSSVLKTPQARDLLYWLEACAEPERDRPVRAALATATLGLSWQRLDHLNRNELAWEEEIEFFRALQRVWQRQGVLTMIRRLLNRFEVPARLLRDNDGERRLTDVLHLAELLQQESQHTDGELALIRRFEDMLLEARAGADAQQMRLESDSDLVKVVTVHKSKGLEYPLVFLPFATNCRPVTRRDAPFEWHDSEGVPQLSFDPTDDALVATDQERLGEDIRKLYVALTRSRYATWVGAPLFNGQELRSALAYLVGADEHTTLAQGIAALGEGKAALAVQPFPAIGDAVYIPPPAPPVGYARVPQRPARDNWWISSYSAIPYRTDDRGQQTLPTRPEIPEPETPEAARLREENEPARPNWPQPIVHPAEGTADLHGFYRGAGPGTFLHNILEWCANLGFPAVADHGEALQDTLRLRCEGRGWAPWAEPLTHWTHGYLHTQFALPGPTAEPLAKASLAELPQAIPELEFWLSSATVDVTALDTVVRRYTLTAFDDSVRARRPIADALQLNGMLKGFIDLVFEYGGRYYVADYKSNYLGPDDSAYTRNAMAAAVADKRYDLQYALYLLALHRLLQSRLPDYDYDRHIGGALCLFLRGSSAETAGAHVDRPGRALIETMDKLFKTGRYTAKGEMAQESLL